VIPNISQNVFPEQLLPPTEEAIKIANKINISRQLLIESMKSFNKLLSSNVLPENRSVGEKKEEQAIIAEMTKAAQEIDQYSGGEGTLALSIFAVRQAIFFRDAGNKLAYEIEEIKKKLAVFEKNSSPKDQNEVAKNRVLEFAKELGVKIAVGNE